MNLLKTLSRNLSDKTYQDLNLLGKARWNAYKWLAGLVLWWRR